MNNDLMFSSSYQAWDTPQDFFDKLDAEFHFTLDPCASHENHKCDMYFTEKEDGLKQSWAGEIVFVNSPYGDQLKHWTKKCYDESKHALVVQLLPARTDTVSYWHKYIYDESVWNWREGVKVRLLKGRLTFGSDAYWEWVWKQLEINGKMNTLFMKIGKKNTAPFPSAIVIYDRRNLYH